MCEIDWAQVRLMLWCVVVAASALQITETLGMGQPGGASVAGALIAAVWHGQKEVDDDADR